GQTDVLLDYAIQFSKDDGRSWNNVAVGVTKTELSFDTSHLPAGKLIFRLMAHDGFHSANATAKSVEMPERAPGLTILHPEPGSQIPYGVPMRLWAAVDLRNGQTIDPKSCHWTLGDKKAGTGSDVYVTAPKPGRHTAVIIVKTRGGTTEAKVEFETFADDEAPN
ncbi:hypothetical protein N9M66_06270, partial [Litoreibacter sp.]|nr:hypothetical protein [Litoreibacter sp.]